MRLLTNPERTFRVEYEDAVVEIKPLSPRIASEVTKRHTKITFSRGERVEETDWIKVQQELFCKCVVGWENVCDEEGKPIECTDEMKRKIALANPKFAGDIIRMASEVEELIREEEIKNSEGGRSGTLTQKG